MYSAAGRLLRGELMAGQGNGEEGVALMREGIAGHRASGTQLGASVWEGAWLADGLLRVGAVAEAGRALDDALAFVERTGERFHEAELWRLRAAVMAHRTGAGGDDAAAALRQAITVAQRHDAKSLELRAAMDLLRLRQSDEAREELARVYEWFQEGFDTEDLAEARGLLERRNV
jgi:adenylate cyclase